MGALILGVVVIFFAPALVWATVIAGLVRIVREKVRESRTARTDSPQRARQPIGPN
jgi:hypothetical protein